MHWILFVIGILVGVAIVHALSVPTWLIGPVIGLYVWSFIADEQFDW